MSESNLLQNYSRYAVNFSYGEGAYLFDESGKEYLDFLSGIAVTGFGHRHPHIQQKVAEQIDKLWHVSNLFESQGQEVLAKKLALVSGLDRAFFCNSGAEAVEAAIKFARKWGHERYHIIAAEKSFHGRTMGSLSATGQPKFWNGFGPMLEGFSFVPFGDSRAVEQAIESETVAVLVEPIQGESGIILPPENYLRSLRDICDAHHLLLILDEVQSGMGRTGKMFAHQWEDIRPDIMTLAKGIANGLPLGAVLCTEEVGECIKAGDHGSTFGGNPVSIASANAVMDLLTDEFLESIDRNGSALLEGIRSLELEAVEEVRGKGLMIGIQLEEGISAKTVVRAILDEGVLVGTSGESVLRILPPFVIAQKEINRFLEVLNQVVQSQFSEEVFA